MSQNLPPFGGEIIPDQDVGLYLHIPFCRKRCHFCAFYLVMQEEERIQWFLRALASEIGVYAAHFDFALQRISTVYVGGGTPTAISPVQLFQVLEMVRTKFSLALDCEVTVEATPESLTSDYMDTLIEAGVTRLSMGIQSFDRNERKCLGLSGNLEETIRGIELVKQSGFANVNFDLIFGIPGQTPISWARTLELASEYEPAHLSCYALTVEKGTRLEKSFREGKLNVIEGNIDQQLQMQAMKYLDRLGFSHYEISNWAKPGRECCHNRRYWLGKDYLGLGPSAQSYMAGCRFGNVSSLDRYCRQLDNETLPILEREFLTISQQQKERVVFGLRLLNGVPLEWIEPQKKDFAWMGILSSLIENKYLVQTSERMALTPKGRQFADEVGCQLL